MRYLIYLRVSTDDQDVETQEVMCIERIKSIHPDGKYTIEFFNENSMSSGVVYTKRIELQKMLNSITKGSTVLVYKLDRLSRDIIEMVTIYRLIVNKCGASVISLNDPYSDEFSVGLMGLIAQKEKENTKIRVKDNLQKKKKKNERYSRYIPYGYKMHETHMVPIKVGKEVIYKPGVLIPLQEEQKIMSLIVRYSELGMSNQDIVNILTDQGYMNRQGKPFHRMSIYRILSRIEDTKLKDQPQEDLKVPVCC